MKKFLTTALSVLTALSLTACSSSTPASDEAENNTDSSTENETVTTNGKIGVILVGDENEGYTAAHMEGIKKAAADLGIASEDIMWKYMIDFYLFFNFGRRKKTKSGNNKNVRLIYCQNKEWMSHEIAHTQC